MACAQVMRPVPATLSLQDDLVTECDSAIDVFLQTAGWRAVADRAYLFRFDKDGGVMTNTHEWCRGGVPSFKDALAHVPSSSLPFIAEQVMQGKAVVLNGPEDLASRPQEQEEMRREGIHTLAIVPVGAPGGGRQAVTGFVGFDACRPTRRWAESDIVALRRIGASLAALSEVREAAAAQLAGRQPQLPEWVQQALRISGPGLTAEGQQQARRAVRCIAPAVPAPSTMPLLVASPGDAALRESRSAFEEKRYAILPPTVWGMGEREQADFVSLCQRRWGEMQPDIAPYTRFRDVGYARYRYYKGQIKPLCHKSFFQIDPEANVLLNSQPRPFNRVADDVREHPMLHKMLVTLLEGVWGGELGEEAHINVHPVRVRNFHEGALHDSIHATLEGTHVDSTERVAVVLIERHNVRPGMPKTALYRPECPVGKRRDIPEHEAEIGPLRVVEHQLAQPLEAITFDDRGFKHDATDFLPAADGERCWRSVMLVMCRRPVQLPSPLDQRDIDGCTPRSEPLDPADCPAGSPLACGSE
eukprot:TRINITY_DN2650_c0_g1_i6.p2 TRINITY_DN2650_c0_g1~~TRINITY_DN2650_c0_g1_i6.p2  ORF type:complete len:559 (+),score=243.70 TRINITY_DN2650_c0_g1_i6:89-1678(+)